MSNIRTISEIDHSVWMIVRVCCCVSKFMEVFKDVKVSKLIVNSFQINTSYQAEWDDLFSAC